MTELLDALYILRADYLETESAKNKALDEAMPEEIRQRLNDIANEYNVKLDEQRTMMNALEEQIRTAALRKQETLKGASGISAIYNAGRVSWDTRGLEGYAKANKAVLAFRKIGEPFITIR